MSLRSTKRKNIFRKRKSVKRGGLPPSRLRATTRVSAIFRRPAPAPAGDGAECTICLKALGTKVFTLDCGHIFHTNCLYTWCDKDGDCTCPVCRRTIDYELLDELDDTYDREKHSPRQLYNMFREYLEGLPQINPFNRNVQDEEPYRQPKSYDLKILELFSLFSFFLILMSIIISVVGSYGIRGGGLNNGDLLTRGDLDNALEKVDPKLLNLTIKELFNAEEIQTKCIKSLIDEAKTDEYYKKYSRMTVRDVIELFKTESDEDKALILKEVNTLLEQCQRNMSQSSSKGSSPTPLSKTSRSPASISKSPGSQASRSPTQRSKTQRSKTQRSKTQRSIAGQ